MFNLSELMRFLTELNTLFGGDKGLDIAISGQGKDLLLRAYKLAVCDGTAFGLRMDADIRNRVSLAWVGEDSEQFLENFTKVREETIAKLEGYYKQLETKLNDIESNWASFRAGNSQS